MKQKQNNLKKSLMRALQWHTIVRSILAMNRPGIANIMVHYISSVQKQKLLAALLLLLMTIEVFRVPLTMAATLYDFGSFFSQSTTESSSSQEKFGLIAVLTEEGLLNNSTNYEGLKPKYPGALDGSTLKDRVQRYALDAQHSQEFTKSVIISVKKDQPVTDIVNSLEKLYLEGDGSGSASESKLIGVVLVGDIPLPVVNKNGHRFMSLLPYTDFVDKTYVLENESGDFVPNPAVTAPKAEAWHGVIRAPADGEDGNRLLALYFDKNHLFHCKNKECSQAAQDFQEFEKKIFYADLVHEFEQLNKAGFGNYLRYLGIWEDISYDRYSKKLLQPLLQGQNLSGGNGLDDDKDGKTDEDPKNGLDDDFDGEKGSPLHGIADGLDNDGDGQIDEADEGRFGLCDLSPLKPAKLKDCSIPGKPMMEGNFYNVKPGSRYFAYDNVDNDGNGLIDEGIDEDDGDPFKNIDNDQDGLIDEDTLQDNDLDADGKIDEDPSGDKNKDGCPGECGEDEDLDSYDFDSDFYPNGYEKEIGSKPAIDIDSPDAQAGAEVAAIPTDPENPLFFPMDLATFAPRISPPPINSQWIDEGSKADDDEDGKVDEDGTADNDNDKDGKADEDSDGTNPPGFSIEEFPDSQTKDLINQLASKYFDLFDKFKANVNDWTNFTGRYQSRYKDELGQEKSDVSTVPGLITAKDEFTRNYVRIVNDLVERTIDGFIENKDTNAPQLQSPIPLIQGAKILPLITLSDDTNIAGKELEFINMVEHEYWDYKKSPPQLTTDVFLNGTPSKYIVDVKDCSLYRGSRGPEGSNSSMVEANHMNNVFDPSTNEDFAGCISKNKFHPELCVKELAKLPLFDILGSRETNNGTESDTSYRACFDLKEKERLEIYFTEFIVYLNMIAPLKSEEQIAVIPKPGSPYQTPDKIIIADLTQANPPLAAIVSLAQLLPIWGGFDQKDNNHNGTIDEIEERSVDFGINPLDNREISERIFGQPGSYVFQGSPYLIPPFIKAVSLQVMPLPLTNADGSIRMISSFSTHKEPTAETLLAQADMGKTPSSIPIDNPRYFTFKDKNGLSRKVKYPNLFAAKSLQELQLILEAKEKELQKIADETGTQISFQGVLTGLLKNSDLYHDTAKKDYLVQADAQKLADAYDWKQSGIDQKHAYVLKTYLNPLQNGYTAETEKGFEALYFNAEAEDQNVLLHFNADIPLSEDDAAFNNSKKQQKPEPTQPGEENIGSSLQALEAYDPSAEQGIDFFQWFGEMQKWVETTMKNADLTNVSQSCSISDAPGNYYEQLLAMGDSDGDGVPDATDPNPNNGDADSDGIPDGAEKTKSFRLTANKLVLKSSSSDTLKITVEAYSAHNEIQKSDNFSQVNLILKHPQRKELANITSVNPVRLTNGKAVFTLMATDESGIFFASTNSPGRSDIVSNTLSLNSSKKQVRVTSYRSGNAVTYSAVSANGFIVKDGNDTIIAEVDGATGMVTITDDRFELVALPAQGPDTIRPTRLGVREKNSKKLYASVFFVADKNQPLTIDSANVNYQNLFQNLKGVHVKNVATGNNVSVDEKNNTGDVPKLYLQENPAQDGVSKRIGMIDAQGNIFLDDSLRLDFKQAQKKNDPVIFEIKNTEGNVLFEVYIGASFPKIQLLKEEGTWTNFNVALQVYSRFVGALKSSNFQFIDFLIPTAAAADLSTKSVSSETFFSSATLVAQNTSAPLLSPTQTPKSIFSDVAPDQTGYKDIMMLYDRGVVSGYSDGTFKPDQSLSREEFVKLDLGSICIRCTEFPSSVKTAIDLVYGQHPFPDQNINPDLQYCVKEGRNRQIISGYGSGSQKGYFLPTNPISRAEALKVILETSRQKLGNFSVEVPDGKPWYYPYIIEAQKQKLFPATSQFFALNTAKFEDFQMWFENEMSKTSSELKTWLEGSVSRREFAMIVARFVATHDCLKDDADNDNLPDNYEKYLYGTSPQNADTDNGGVQDGAEVTRKTNPLNPADDKDPDDNDGMPADFEKKYGLDPNDASDASKDLDGDGLKNVEEFNYGTDPTKPDTDNGGIWDGDEILMQIHPLKSEDDGKIFSEQGGYIVSNTAYENLVYAQQGADNREQGRILDYVSEIPSDGSSKLLVKANILNENGLTDKTDSSSIVQFTAMENSGEHAVILQKNVKVVQGEAETEIQSTTKAGSLLISAVVQNGNVPTDIHTIDVLPQKPVSIQLFTDSPIIRSGGLSSTLVHAELQDVNKNIVNNGVHQLTFKVDGSGTLDESVDEVADKEGIQISSITGSFEIRLLSSENPGNVTVTATYEPPVLEEAVLLQEPASDTQAVNAQTTVQARNDIQLQLAAEKPEIPSDFTTTTKIYLKVTDGKGITVSDMRGNAALRVTDPKLGKIVGEPEVNVVDGQAEFTFQASNIAGDALITATIEGFEPATAVVKTLPKAPAWIEVESDEETIDIGTEITIRAKLYDRDGNFVWNDSNTFVDFTLTESTKKFGTFKVDTKVKAANGIAAITLQSTTFTGPLNIVASGEKLLSSALSLKSVQKMKPADFKALVPDALFATFLGSDFGDVTNREALANWFLFSETTGSSQNGFSGQQVGKTQVMSTLTSKPKPFLQLVEIASNGALHILDEERFAVRVLPATATFPYQRFALSDLLAKKDVAEISLMLKPQNKTHILAAEESLKEKPEGVYVQKITEAENYELRGTEQGVSVLRDKTSVADVNNNGSVTLFSNDIVISLSKEQKNGFLTLQLEEAGTVIVEVSYVTAFETDAQYHEPGEANVQLITGVHVQLLQKFPHLRFESIFSGNSSAMPKGLALVDSKEFAPELQRPGLNYLSLEKADETRGLGFTGDNKQMLLYAAGNSVGESTLPYASEIGIVLGDPTIRLQNKNTVSSGTGFTQDIGKEIFVGDEPVQKMVTLDYNGDGLKDVFVAYKSGKIRLLQNRLGVPRFEDKGIFLNFPNGLVSLASADIDKDSFDDLIVATQDSCKKGEVCVDLYHNNKGNFERNNLALKPFSEKNRVYNLETADVNNDGYADVLTSDDTGTLRVFYNSNGKIQNDGKFIGTLGLHIDSTANLKTEVTVWYNGLPSPSGTEASQQFVPLALEDITRNFLYLDLDNNLGLQSEKKALDITGAVDSIARGDEIEYTITLKNTSQKTLQNVWVNDVISDSLEFKKDSLKCVDCKAVIVETGISLRPFAIGGFDIPAGKTRTITYRAVVKDGIKVRMSVGHNLTDGYAVDNYLDISASPENNPTGRTMYFYSSGKDSVSGHIQYKSYTTPPPPPPEQPTLPAEQGGIDTNLLKTDLNNDGVPDQVQNWVDEYVEKNKDSISSQVEEAGKTLDTIGDTIEAGIAAFTCKGGCLPLPVNFAFLAPGAINVMGVPGGFDPGLPVFAAGIPSLIPVWPPSPYQGSVVRTYLSPTLTGSLGMGICMGPYLGGQCFAFKVADLIPADICEKIAGEIQQAIAGANTVAHSPNGTSIFNSDGTIPQGNSSSRFESGGISGSTNLGNYSYKASLNTNFRIPGFPAVITNWLDRQTEEIVNKITDLPDIYFIYPDPTSIAGMVIPQDSAQQTGASQEKPAYQFPKVKKWTNFRQVLNYLNSIPLVQIQAQEVLIKIPAITDEELMKLQRDAQQWLADTKAELERFKQIWSCDKNTEYKTICDSVTLQIGSLIQGVEKNLETLEKYKELPRKILAWRSFTAKYAYQIICYLDAIIKYTGGYIHKQQSRIDGWIEMIRKIKQTLADWKLLVDLTVEYQASCDKCTTARFTLMELILKLFAILPEPPIIPFPKLPDIAIDISQIQTGLQILWPDVRFRPEPLIMPKLPRIQLPGIPSLNISVEFPPIPLLPEPPELPELPDLPPLPLPTLPDIPPPPDIPSFPASIRGTISLLQKIIRILCLIKKGLVPISEILLKSHIEQLTERPLSPLLPFDLGIKLQFPPIKYDYVDRITFLSRFNLQIDFSQVYEFVQLLADKANSITTNLVEAVNNGTAELSNKAQQGADTFNNAVNKVNPLGEETKQIDVDLSSSLQQFIAQGDVSTENSAHESFNLLSEIYPDLGSVAKEFSQSFEALEQDAKKYQQLNENVKDFELTATQRLLSSDDPLLNRSLEEVKSSIASEVTFQNSTDKRMVALRNALIAFADDQNQLDASLQSNENLLDMVRLLAHIAPLSERVPSTETVGGSLLLAEGKAFKPQPTLAASLEGVASPQQNTFPQDKSIQKTAFVDYAKTTQKGIKNSVQLLADIGLPDVPENSGMPDSIAVNKGLFIYNQAAQVNERLINYTDEADLPSQLTFIDFDNDVDNDVLYSYGGNIYLKENFTFNPVRTYVGDSPALKKLEDFEPAYGAVQNFIANYAGNKQIDMNWDKSPSDNIGGYEISLAKTITGFDTEKTPLFKVALIHDTSLKSESLVTAESVEGDVVVQVADAEELNNSSPQKLRKGEVLNYDTIVTSKNGNAILRLNNGSYVTVEPNEAVLVAKLDNPEHPGFTMELPNGFYYAKINVFDTVGRRGTRTPATLLAPTLCGDKQTPFPNAGDSQRNVAILKTLTIDASKSFDPGSSISAYWLDADVKSDAQPDGNPTNDKDIMGDLDARVDSNGDGIKDNDVDNPVFPLGPYEDLNDRVYKLNIVDEAGNEAGQEITVKVYVPSISLDDVTATAGIVQGKLEPGESNMPFSIFSVRNGIRTKITTPSADVNGKYFTDANGEFLIDDLNLEDNLVILNAKGEIIAEINQQTGQIVLVRKEYSLDVLPAEKPLLPTRIVVKDPNGIIITTLFLVADLNTDATIDDPGIEYTRETVNSFKSVHVKDADPLDDILMQKIAANDSTNPGAVELVEGSSKKRVALMDTGGNFYVLNEKIGLRLREGATLQDPLVVQIILKGSDSEAVSGSAGNSHTTLLGEFYVALNKNKPLEILSSTLFELFKEGAVNKGPLFDTDKDGMPDQWELTYRLNPNDTSDALKDNDGDGLNNKAEYRANTNPNNPDSDGDGYNDKDELVYGKNANEKATSPFDDVNVSDPHYQSILDLSQRNVLKGKNVGGSLMFDPNGNITRKEFADIMLKIFCITPRKQAYEAPAPFSDVPYDPQNPYYAIIKEAYFQGFITGYLGELNPVTGKAPFKPDNTISRAEASKIILEALEREGAIDLGKVPVTEPWYSAYMQASQDLAPYLKEKSAVNHVFINSAEETKNPTKALTRGEFVTVADRVLTAYDCTKIDDDGDGMPGYWEAQHGLNPNDPTDSTTDPDGDKLINRDEYTYGTDPFDADTDNGGVKDGVEIEKGTNAATNPGDDPQDTDGDGLTDQAEKNVFGTDPLKADTDGGGIKDGDEVLIYNINPLQAKDDKDSDKDGLSDSEETNIYKTNPLDPDTDDGGIQDGAEVQRGTDPLNKIDDITDPRSSLEEGIYLIQGSCMQCPCPSSLAHTADVLPGDTIFAVISKNNESEIFSKSNEVKITGVPKK